MRRNKRAMTIGAVSIARFRYTRTNGVSQDPKENGGVPRRYSHSDAKSGSPLLGRGGALGRFGGGGAGDGSAASGTAVTVAGALSSLGGSCVAGGETSSNVMARGSTGRASLGRYDCLLACSCERSGFCTLTTMPSFDRPRTYAPNWPLRSEWSFGRGIRREI